MYSNVTVKTRHDTKRQNVVESASEGWRGGGGEEKSRDEKGRKRRGKGGGDVVDEKGEKGWGRRRGGEDEVGGEPSRNTLTANPSGVITGVGQ